MCGCECHDVECMTFCSKCRCVQRPKSTFPFKAGQKVKITYPTGTVVHATLSHRGSKCLGYHLNEAEYMERVIQPDGSLTRSCAVEILSEPRPAEPTGLGAVVEAGDETCPEYGRALFVRMTDPIRPWESAELAAAWEHLTDPVVLSDGWTP